MSFYALVAGVLAADPQRREGAKGSFATASLKVASGTDSLYASLIAFGGTADELLDDYSAGDPLSVSGRAQISEWTGRDGAPRHGLNIVVEKIAAVKPKRAARADRRPRPMSPRARRRHRSVPPSPSRPLPDDRVDDLWRGDEMGP